ncbi:AraC family transcriptional regulator [Chengkuizengella axinellae]|uniref:AraC family transcriptional regulator n=1 Tax=Chengkuizengella axinellae TaxID=3064388 RepID=A0ABT9J1D5_9BACL|nr:AraC family transcriptional regulator [Chengkuizengella sp. 2205SS18-9]MDP5274830.1 AraC family transcriptional regulator [Chengkuizengella sp. 2205SS18-9]
MKFPSKQLHEEISIPKLISFHYFEYARGYVFEGERHDFWEFVYVDKGEVEVQADDRKVELKQGQMMFHKPDEFHTVCVRDCHKPPNLVVLSFECSSPAMFHFQNQILSLRDVERNLLSNMLEEGFMTFNPPFDDPDDHLITKSEHAPFAGEQLVKSYLEILLIQLIRNIKKNDVREPQQQSTVQKENVEKELIEDIIDYMNTHMYDSLSIDQLCKQFHLGKTRLKELFQSHKRSGVLEYFKAIKIENAKTLIREKQYSYTMIAEKLGYASIHYFSRDFKKTTGMSPTEYAKSVFARIDKSSL